MYIVIDTHTKNVLSTHSTLKQARNKCDRLDSAYGSIRYTYKSVFGGFNRGTGNSAIK